MGMIPESPVAMEEVMADKSVSVTACVNSTHYWIIDPPDSRISRGVCKHCKEEREFNNSSAFDGMGSWNLNFDFFGRRGALNSEDNRANRGAMSYDR